MDADSSYGGSDTAQDSTCGNENSSLENTTIISQSDTSQNDVSHNPNNLVSTISVNTEENPYYNKNEITLPVNRDETDFKSENSSTRLPHYLTTANLNINETLEHHSNLEALSKQYRSTSYLNADSESPPSHRKSGLDNPAFDDDEEAKEKQSIKSSFDQNKPYNGDLNLSVNSSIQNDEPLTEAVNLELINLKPSGKDVTGLYENGKNGMTSIPMKPDVDAELGNPYDEYFVPVNEHKKYMSKFRNGRNSVTFAESLATSSGYDDGENGSGVMQYHDWIKSQHQRGEKLYVTMDKRNVKKKSRCLCWGVCISIVLAAVIVGILAAVGVIGTKPVQEVSSRQFSGSTPEVKTGGIFGLPADLDTSDTSGETSPKYTPGPSSTTVPYPLTTDMSDISVPRALESQIKIDNMEFDQDYLDKNSKKFQDLASTIEAELKEAIFTEDELMYGPADIEVKVIDFTEGSIIARYRITWKFKDGLHNTKDPIDANLLEERMAERMRENHNHLSVFQINEEASMNKTMRVLDSCKIQNFGCEYKCLFNYTSAEFTCICPEGEALNENGKNCDKIAESNLPELSNEDKQPSEPIPEPEFEPEPLAEPGRIPKVYSQTTPEPHAEPTSEPHAEPTSEPHVEPNSEPHAEPTSEPHAEPSSDTYAEPTSEPRAAVTSGTYSELTSESHAESNYELHVETTYEPHAEPTSEPHAEPTSEPHAEPTSEPHAEPTSEPHTEPSSDVYAELTSEPLAEATSEPHAEPTSEPNAKPTSESFAEPTSEPRAEPTSEPYAELKSETHAEPTSKLHVEPTSEPHVESTSEPNAEPTSEPHAESTAKPHTEHSTHVHKEAIIVPIQEFTTDSQTKDILIEQTTEPQAEPTSEPLAEPTTTFEIQSSSELILKSMAVPSSTSDSPSSDETLQPTTEPRSESITEISFEEEFMTFKPPPEPQTTSSTSEQSMESMTPFEDSIEVNRKLNISIQPEASITSTESSGSSELGSNHSIEDFVTEETYITKNENMFNMEFSTQSEPLSEQESTTESLPQFVENQSFENGSNPIDIHQNQTIAYPETIHETKTELPLTSESNSTAEILPDFNTEMSVVETERNMNTVMNISSEEHNHQSSNEISTLNPLSVDNTQFSTSDESIPIAQITTIIPPTTLTSLVTELGNATTLKNENYTSSVVTNSVDTSQDGLITINPHLFGQNFNEEISTERLNENVHVFNKTMEGEKSEKIIDQSEESNKTEKLPEVTDQLTTPRHVEELTESTNKKIPETHQDILMNEPNEYSNHLEIMSPFLPEIENDTFINSLRSDDHFVDHNMHSNLDSSDEYIVTTKAPRLDNDQQNKTNPLDPNPTDSMSIDRENFIKEQVTEALSYSVKPINENVDSNFRMGKKNDYPTENVTSNNISENIKTEEIITTEPISPEILNNVHSNAFFDKIEQSLETTKQPDNLDETTFEITTMEGVITKTTRSELHDKLPDVSESIDEFTISSAETNNIVRDSSTDKDDTNISSSTEDLIAMETTTYGMKTNPGFKFNKKSKSIKYLSEQNKLQDKVKVTESIQQKQPEINSQVDTNFRTYEVEESVIDSTTTTKLFVTKPTTIDPLLFTTIEEEKTLNNSSEATNNLNDIFNEDLLNKSGKIEETTSADKKITTQMLTEDYKMNMKNEKYFGKELRLDEPLLTTLNEIATKSVNEVKPVTEGFTIMGFTRCESDQFQCINGTSVSNGKYCIPMVDRCDSVVDCSDGSDEINCQEEGCSNNFQCSSGRCLKRHLVCDGIVNCDDNSDEINCESWNCTLSEFSCGENDRCIPSTWKCDGRSHCKDSSDENGCNRNECPDNHFRCSEGGTCIPNAWRCDGKTDCLNAEDEKECGCSNNEFKCKIGGGCINLNQVCDGVSDCGDKSDEWKCLTLHQSTAILEAHLKNETSLICSTNWNATYADLVCEAMGYNSPGQYEEVATPSEATNVLKIKDNANYGLAFLMNLENMSSCEKVVTVKCQKPACGIESGSVPIIGDSTNNETYNLPSLTLLYNNKQNVYCSGSLISQSWVVTAYSCIVGSLNGLDMSPDDWVIKIGGQQRMVVDFIEHPKVKYSNFYYNNDVVLIKLDRPVTSTKNVSAMCVPEGILNETQRCAIAGWKNIEGGAAKEQYFHYLAMPLISIQECNSSKHYNGMMSQGEICVESEQADNFPCYDDMGSPLLCLSGKTKMWELQGILSHTNKCEVTRHPLVYTSVNKDLVTWMENTIGQAVSANSL